MLWWFYFLITKNPTCWPDKTAPSGALAMILAFPQDQEQQRTLGSTLPTRDCRAGDNVTTAGLNCWILIPTRPTVTRADLRPPQDLPGPSGAEGGHWQATPPGCLLRGGGARPYLPNPSCVSDTVAETPDFGHLT